MIGKSNMPNRIPTDAGRFLKLMLNGLMSRLTLLPTSASYASTTLRNPSKKERVLIKILNAAV